MVTVKDKKLTLFEVSNANGLFMTLSSYGASLIELYKLEGSGKINLVAGYSNLENFYNDTNNEIMGGTLGRYARCIKFGKFKIEGEEYQLRTNENGHHFHGGDKGFHKKDWLSSFYSTEHSDIVCFSLFSPDGDQGYPGNVNVSVEYELTNNDEIIIRYFGKSDKSTLIGMSNHIFWSLGAENSINNLQLRFNTDYYIQADNQFIPSGQLIQVYGTEKDFTSIREIGNVAIDECFVSNDKRRPKIRLQNIKKNIRLDITSNQSCIAIYTGDNLSKKRSGIAIQPGPYPDAPNQFPGSGSILSERKAYTNLFKAKFSF